jgi:hypothetical protein
MEENYIDGRKTAQTRKFRRAGLRISTVCWMSPDRVML